MYSKDLNNIGVESTAAGDEDEENSMENEMANKLDILMEILFKHIQDITHINGKVLFKFKNKIISQGYWNSLSYSVLQCFVVFFFRRT